MSANLLSQKLFKPTPPIQGSFPLDHDSECKKQMLEYMICLSRNEQKNEPCRFEAREYLQCRINRNLMDKQDLDQYGFKDVKKQQQQVSSSSKE